MCADFFLLKSVDVGFLKKAGKTENSNKCLFLITFFHFSLKIFCVLLIIEICLNYKVRVMLLT